MIMMTRRTFVGVLAVVAAVGGLGLGGGVLRRRQLAMDELVPLNLQPLQGTVVSLCARDGRTLRAVVEDVGALRRPARRGAPATEQISLLVAADDREAGAGRYRLESADLSLGDLYFSPVGPQGRERRLEAVITRIV